MPATWTFFRGLLGFPEITNPSFDYLPDTRSYAVLRDDPTGIELVLANASDFFPDFEFDLPESTVTQLGLTDPGEADVWVVVTPGPAGEFSVNLRGPLVVHRDSGRAAQVVLNDAVPVAAPLAA